MSAGQGSPGSLARAVGAVLPEQLSDRVRVLLAQRLESRLRRSGARRGAALVFHSVAERAGDAQLELDPAVAVDRLDAVVGYLARRYELVRAAELPSAVAERTRDGPFPIAVTFDDDLASHRYQALPVLRHHGVVATVFLCGRRTPFWWQLLQLAVDSRALAPADVPHVESGLVAEALERRPGAIGRVGRAIERLDPARRDDVARVLEAAVPGGEPMLAADDVAELITSGWEIGFHTRRHDPLATLDDDALRDALTAGRDGALTFAYPHGRADEREAAAAREAGYVAAYTGRAEIVTDATDPHLLGRLQPSTVTVGRFALELARRLAAPL
jgi:peptidoglycan/xylan/chitin deacetylase (PgdA/CDA1 family)